MFRNPDGLLAKLPASAAAALHAAELGLGAISTCYESVGSISGGGYAHFEHYKISGGKYPLMVVLVLRVNVLLTIDGVEIKVASFDTRYPESGAGYANGPGNGSGLCIASTNDRSGDFTARYPYASHLMAGAWTGSLTPGGYCGSYTTSDMRGQFTARAALSSEWSSTAPAQKAVVEDAVNRALATTLTRANQVVFAESAGLLSPYLRTLDGSRAAITTYVRFALSSFAKSNPGAASLLNGEAQLMGSPGILQQLRAAADGGGMIGIGDIASLGTERAKALQTLVADYLKTLKSEAYSDEDAELASAASYLKLMSMANEK